MTPTQQRALSTAMMLLAYQPEDYHRHADDLARARAVLERLGLRRHREDLAAAESAARAHPPRHVEQQWCAACGARLTGAARRRTCSVRCRAAAWRGVWVSPFEAELRALGVELSDCWATPPLLIAALVSELGPVVLDAAATRRDTIAPAWIGPAEDALKCSWALFLPATPGWIWVNPPYSQTAGGLARWLAVAHDQAMRLERLVVVCAPPGIGTAYREWAERHACEIRDLARRVQFLHPITRKAARSPREGSSLFLFRPSGGPARVHTWRVPCP